jgi:hypothetical protein
MLRGSAEAPDAVRYESYRPMAERAHQGRLGIPDEMITAPADAANAIVDAILDAIHNDGAPLRSGCDPLGRGLLDAWRGTSDEEMMRNMLGTWVEPAP